MAVRSLGRDEGTASGYNHARWDRRRRFLRFLLRWPGSLLFKVDRVDGLEHFPRQGPAILMINHIAFVDPIVVLHVAPRQIVPLAKVEAYDYPVIGIFPYIWGVIPVRRGTVDRKAIRQALDVLKAGEIILMAPEGTRGSQLQPAREGVAYLASHSGAPVVPVAVENTPGFPTLPILPRWRKGGVRVTFGRPFRVRAEYRRPSREQLSEIANQAMYVLASILPDHRRGVYADLNSARMDLIEWV